MPVFCFRKLAFASDPLHEQARRSGHDPDLGYRQIAEMLSYGAQPPSLPWPAREDQLVIIASAERKVQWISTAPAEPFAKPW